jgi:hypothetical protein
MRRVAGGGSTTSIWLSNEGWLPLREKAAHVIHSLMRIWVNCCRLRHKCTAISHA